MARPFGHRVGQNSDGTGPQRDDLAPQFVTDQHAVAQGGDILQPVDGDGAARDLGDAAKSGGAGNR